MEVITLLSLAALIWKIVDVIKFLINGDRSAVTQLVVWAVGVAVAFLGAWADITAGLPLWDDFTLGSLDVGSKILIGLMLPSLVSVGVDYKKAIDNSDSAAVPSLFPAKSP